MNTHVEAMKKAVQGYYSALVATDAKMRHNSEVYQPEAARSENQRLQADIDNHRMSAEAEIRAAIAEGQKSIDAWMNPDGTKLTADADLLKYGVSVDDFRKLVQKYRDNYSMSQLLQRYGDAENKRMHESAERTGKMPETLYPVWEVRSAENRKAAYEKIGIGALQLIAAMHERPSFGTGLQSESLKQSVEMFGNPTPNSASVYDML